MDAGVKVDRCKEREKGENEAVGESNADSTKGNDKVRQAYTKQKKEESELGS